MQVIVGSLEYGEFLIHGSSIVMDLCNELCLSVLCGKIFRVGYYTETFQPNFFIPAMLRVTVIGTIDFYHFIPFSWTLSLPGGHKVSAKQNLFTSFLAHFSSDQDEIGLYSDIHKLISFKFGMVVETTKLYILISVWMTMTFI